MVSNSRRRVAYRSEFLSSSPLIFLETVAFRADMTSTGSTVDVTVKRNDTPMTNEMLADRIGLIPINISEPLTWKSDKYVFTLKVAGDKDNTTYVKSGDFKIKEIVPIDALEPDPVPTEKFFPPNFINWCYFWTSATNNI